MEKSAERALDRICEIKERLIEEVEKCVHGNLETANTKELGEVIDMIKDLAETERNCYEGCYYKAVTDAMDEIDPEDERMGYNNRRYSSGRYAPAGRGHMGGYTLPMRQAEYMRDYLDDPEGFRNSVRMGYRETGRGMNDSRYGKAYNDYQESRRHFTETHSEQSKREMDAHAHEHVGDTIATIRDIWKSADPELKKKMKADFTNLVGEMTV